MSKPVMEKIGIFGGTFNPVHNGHVLLARHYVQALGLQKLLVIPAKTPPHKLAPELAAEQLRLQMCALAFADLPQAQVSDLEICRPGKSYTIDTVYKLRQLYPQAQLYLLVGSDMFLSFERWKSWQQILQQVTLCTAARSSGELLQLRRHARQLMPYGSTLVFDFPVLEVSSTQIRRRLKEGLDCSQLLPEKVYQQILQQNLYRG
mgnify:CR=1 FL=1